MPFMRLDKYISDCGAASRREIKQMIKAGRISVNGAVAAAPEAKIDPAQAVVSIDGAVLKYEKYRYFMLNKPAGVLSATDDGRQRKPYLICCRRSIENLTYFPLADLIRTLPACL